MSDRSESSDDSAEYNTNVYTQDYRGILKSYKTLTRAFAACRRPNGPSKLMWMRSTGNGVHAERWVRKTSCDVWLAQVENHLIDLNPAYETLADSTVFWVRQRSLPRAKEAKYIRSQGLSEAQCELVIHLSCMREIITEEAFMRRFIEEVSD
jgi:sarcosine oxidase delta subunit